MIDPKMDRTRFFGRSGKCLKDAIKNNKGVPLLRTPDWPNNPIGMG
jgi:hypothetical protein